MRKNGFTLIELIATIGILGMLATLVITVSVKRINETKEKARDTMIESIELAAKNYVIDYKNELTDFNKYDFIYITLQTLVEKEYFTNSLIDPTTEKSLSLSDTVYVVRESNGNITAKYDIKQKQKAKLVLNGSYNEYIKKGNTFIDSGITATSSDGTDVSNSILVEGNVNTSNNGTYIITYKYDNVIITRNVIVYEENIPSIKIPTGVQYIENLYEESPKKNNLINKNGMRYVGSNPNNYVYYNCDDEDTAGNSYGEEDYNYSTSCEKWRIIGIFDVSNGTKTESRVKLIRDASLGYMSWDSSYGGEGIENSINFGYGVNEWSQADLKEMLNTYYIGESDSCKYCNGVGQATCENSCNSTVKKLSDISLTMIEDAVWYIGAIEWIEEMPVDVMYAGERGTQNGKICEGTIYEGGKYCTDGVARTTEWKGLVGLIYPSDYGYASTHETCTSDIVNTDSTCENDNWLHPSSGYYWTMSPHATSSSANDVWLVGFSESVAGSDAPYALGVRPSVYLRSNVQITEEGNGTSISPYILKLK